MPYAYEGYVNRILNKKSSSMDMPQNNNHIGIVRKINTNVALEAYLRRPI